MAQQVPKLLFIGAGNIAQNIIKRIIRKHPNAARQILATAPTTKNLDILQKSFGCQVTLLNGAVKTVTEFEPEMVLICLKPQVVLSAREDRNTSIVYNKFRDLNDLYQALPSTCVTLSMVTGVHIDMLRNALHRQIGNIARVTLNTTAAIDSTSVFYYMQDDFKFRNNGDLEHLLGLIGHHVVKLNDEKLMDVATGICESCPALFYETIMAFSDVGVLNGMNKTDAIQVAAQVSKSAGEMLLARKVHPYQLRDEVASPAGTTIYGIREWHEQSINQKIARSVQASVDGAKNISETSRPQTSPEEQVDD